MMAAVRNKNSKAELALRRELHRRGIRYRLHARNVLGHPDLVWRGKRVAVFVDGDMWHGNPAAWKARGLATFEEMFPNRTDWWVAKIHRTRERDAAVTAELKRQGWSVVRLWESDVIANPIRAADRVVRELASP
jgi:DNA mismatch endonuclease (patch repair protein)